MDESEESAIQALSQERAKGARMVFTNGCFDLLHVGHIRYLAEARALGTVLVVGLNSDRSVQVLKGADRPVVDEADRREMLLALRMVDYVIIFDEDTPLRLIQAVRPDVLVKGGDWPVEKIVGAEFVQSYGGTVQCLSFVPGKSTTALLAKL